MAHPTGRGFGPAGPRGFLTEEEKKEMPRVTGSLLKRIFDYFDKESTIVSPENGLKPEFHNQDICFEHVEFSYEPDKPLLILPAKLYRCGHAGCVSV